LVPISLPRHTPNPAGIADLQGEFAVPNSPTSTTVTQRLKGTMALRSSLMPFAPVSMPKGDPSLSAQLASLSKEERKRAKAADADRIARRAAKKKAKMTMMKGVVKGTKEGVDSEQRVRAWRRAGGAREVGSARKEVKKKVETTRKLGMSIMALLFPS
jgi:hypothetical protein